MHPNFRRDLFFWLGVGVFPVFWSWFTLGKKFPKWQRWLALGWMSVVLAAIVVTWPQMAERYHLVTLGLPTISFAVTAALWAWLVLRTITVIELAVLLMALGAPLGRMFMLDIQDLPLQNFSLHWILWPLIPALLHLALEPGGRAWARVEQRSMGVRMFWICLALLPAFFVWFTIDRYFTKQERILSWCWAAVYSTVVLALTPPFILMPFAVATAFMAIVAARQWWRSRTDNSDEEESR